MFKKMDPLASVDLAVERTVNRLEKYKQSYSTTIDGLIKQATKLKTELLQDSDDLSVAGIVLWEQCIRKNRTAVQQLGSEHRALHSGVSKCGKEIDRSFTSDFSDLTRHAEHYEKDEETRARIDALIAEHFLSNGQMNLAESLAKESGVDLDWTNKQRFINLHRILDALKRHDVDPAMEWAKENKDKLRERGSALQFKLYRLKFVETVKRGVSGQADALKMIPQLQQFSDSHENVTEIHALVGCLMYLPQGIGNSPYAHLLDQTQWSDASNLFLKDACALIGIPVNSPLSVLLNAGTVALPALLNLRNAMHQRHVIGVWGAEELPIEIELGPENHFHSVFACPILRQQTSESNPPVRLICGHVISRDALNRLASSNSRLKCPYCPAESMVSDAIRVYF